MNHKTHAKIIEIKFNGESNQESGNCVMLAALVTIHLVLVLYQYN